MACLRAILIGLILGVTALPAHARDGAALRGEVLFGWYDLVLELVRHTPTYSPPVAARAFAYVGVISHEAQAALDPRARTLAGQLNGLTALRPWAPRHPPQRIIREVAARRAPARC